MPTITHSVKDVGKEYMYVTWGSRQPHLYGTDHSQVKDVIKGYGKGTWERQQSIRVGYLGPMKDMQCS